MLEIIVDIAPDGQAQVTTKGFRGKACLAATKDLEEALGKKLQETATPEMHLAQPAQVKARG